jgi:DNA polymerase III delta subunit
MIYIVHGNNTTYIRNIILNQQKKLGIDSRKEYAVGEITPSDLRTECHSADLFGGNPFIVLDITAAGRKNLDEYVEVAEKIPAETTLIIMAGKELSKTNAFIKNAVKLKAKAVVSPELPAANVFKYIASLFNGDRTRTYKELQQLLKEGQDPIYLFSMVLYGLRNVAFVTLNSPSLNKVAPFARSQAQKQAVKFNEKGIIKLFDEFYIMDKKLKTGEIRPETGIALATEKVLGAYVRTEKV